MSRRLFDDNSSDVRVSDQTTSTRSNGIRGRRDAGCDYNDLAGTGTTAMHSFFFFFSAACPLSLGDRLKNRLQFVSRFSAGRRFESRK